MTALTTGTSGIISFIGVGSNLEDPLARALEAIEYMRQISGCRVLRRSSFYQTEPVGVLDQHWFINAVVEIRTELTAVKLLGELQEIEKRMGRQKQQKWGPRVIDLDILLHGQEVIGEDDLIVPHPELHKRRFALEPLHEIASYVIHPAFGISIAGLRERLTDKSKVEIIKETRMVS